jgi:hypothetical protein
LRKLMLGALTALLVIAGLVGGAQAAPGPNDSNNHGLCTAYFNGQKEGHDKNGNPGPFAALATAAAEHTDSDGVDNDGDGEVDEDGESADLSESENIYNYCEGLVGGNEDHGRFTCVLDTDDETDGNQTECTENEKPGNGDDA